MDNHVCQSHYPIYVLGISFYFFVYVIALSSYNPFADLLSLPGGTKMISDNVKCHEKLECPRPISD